MDIKSKIKNIKWLDRFYVEMKWRERRVSYGCGQPEKIFFVVRRATCKVGLFSYVMTNMGWVKYALDHGYIPVIDMQNNKNTYLEDEKVGKANAWEQYFEQPCGYSLQDIANCRNVILGSGLIKDFQMFPGKEIASDTFTCQAWRSFFSQYLRMNQAIVEEVDLIQKELFEDGRVLGVLCRGTDYVNTRPKGHPIQPDVKTVIKKALETKEAYTCDWLFLATEDEEVYQKFKEEFGERLKTSAAPRYKNTGLENINDVISRSERGKYIKGKEYLITISLLARCNCLVAGSVGGTYGALLMSRGFEYQYIYDLGNYT